MARAGPFRTSGTPEPGRPVSGRGGTRRTRPPGRRRGPARRGTRSGRRWHRQRACAPLTRARMPGRQGRRLAGELKVARQGIDAGDRQPEPPGQFRRRPALTAAHVNGDSAWCHRALGEQIEEQVRTTRAQALAQRRSELLLDPRVGVIRLLQRPRPHRSLLAGRQPMRPVFVPAGQHGTDAGQPRPSCCPDRRPASGSAASGWR